MNKIFKAKILWLSKEQGGRQTGLPCGDKYGPVVTINGAPLNSSEACWSLIVENTEKISEFETIAEVHYLSDKAPDNLKKDTKIDLYEGAKLVAKGIIL